MWADETRSGFIRIEGYKEKAMEERVWVERAQHGDQTAFAHLVEVYQGPVYNLAYRMLGSAQDAEDAAQETFLRAYVQFDTYQPERRFASWLLAIAAHYCIDQLRRRRFTWLPLDDLPFLDWIGGREAEPEGAALQREERDQVRQLLDHLPPNYRLVIVLRYWYDLSCQEIADVAGLTESAVKTRLYRAREMMAQGLTASETKALPTYSEEARSVLSNC
jgi:RNA polymerase sigma-70 factor (ECF subfamily)